MKKTHIIVLAIIFVMVASLVFAQQNTVTYGVAVAAPTANGIVVEGEEVTVPVVPPVHKPAVKKPAVNQQQAGMKATHAQNAASLKKGEPKLKVNTTTTETDVYDMNVKNKKGTTDYEMVEQTVTGPKGHQTTEGVIYSSYQPSKAARANAKKMEVSLAGGGTFSYNKDGFDERYSSVGLAASVSALYDVTDHLAVGLDYTMLHPSSKTHGAGVDRRHYHGMYAHDISLAGKLTINPWDNFQIYSPMGVGMMNAKLRTEANGINEHESKWGAAAYIGLGMQYDITCWMFAGLEYRYTYGFISDKDLTALHKDRDLQFHSLLLRVGMRF